jgi:hypothetical protein
LRQPRSRAGLAAAPSPGPAPSPTMACRQCGVLSRRQRTRSADGGEPNQGGCAPVLGPPVSPRPRDGPAAGPWPSVPCLQELRYVRVMSSKVGISTSDRFLVAGNPDYRPQPRV